jgi:2,5-diamino-6-(ribosylamino)-4(3H)-pyrimidinone 5'-phosphate reductase
MARPHVVVHVAVSLDGATTGFEPDVGRFYALAATWEEDLTLAGADTILAQEAVLRSAPRPGPAQRGPLLAVVDARRRVPEWDALRDCGHWSGVVALRGAASSGDGAGAAVAEIATGGERVDLGAALGLLAARHGVRTARIDSGGALTGALLRAGLVDEVSLLVHPCIAGAAGDRRWHGPGDLPPVALERIAVEALEGGLTWLRFSAPGGARGR